MTALITWNLTTWKVPFNLTDPGCGLCIFLASCLPTVLICYHHCKITEQMNSLFFFGTIYCGCWTCHLFPPTGEHFCCVLVHVKQGDSWLNSYPFGQYRNSLQSGLGRVWLVGFPSLVLFYLCHWVRAEKAILKGTSFAKAGKLVNVRMENLHRVLILVHHSCATWWIIAVFAAVL